MMFNAVQGTVFVFKCMYPASCELGGGKGNEMAWQVGAWAGGTGLLASAGLGNLGFVWGKVPQALQSICKGGKGGRDGGRMDSVWPIQ